MSELNRRLLLAISCVVLPLVLGGCKNESQTSKPVEQTAAASTEDEAVWTPEMQAADDAREQCIVAINEKLGASPNFPDPENMPQRIEDGWTWTAYAEDLGVRTDFICTIADGNIVINLK